MTKILIIGPQCSGKGTQGKLLEKYGFTHLSSGDLIRKSNEKVIGDYKKSGKYNLGIFLEDEYLFKLLEENLPKNSKKYTLDGFVRNITQAEYVKKRNLVDLVFYLKVNEKITLDRMIKRAKEEKRTDDTPKLMKSRLEIYHKETKPILSYLKKNFEFYEIDGSKSIQEVHEDVKKVLGLN